jgi:hypothetical protein
MRGFFPGTTFSNFVRSMCNSKGWANTSQFVSNYCVRWEKASTYNEVLTYEETHSRPLSYETAEK